MKLKIKHPKHLENLYLDLYANSGNISEFNKILLIIRAERDKLKTI